MGHIAHMRNYYIKREKEPFSHFDNCMGLIDKTLNSLQSKMFVPCQVEIGTIILEKFVNFGKEFLVLRYYFPLENGAAFHLTNLNPITKRCFVPSLVEIARVDLQTIIT